ncbi:MAG: phosphoribosylanthranilate isomerase [Phycisphaerales bacterium]|nr:phosphoribosylanthranilate isomerase [Phycisphaerales bacterium]
MPTKLKVCCIASIEEMRLAIAHGADAIGLVARMPSGPGPIPDELITEIAARIPSGIDSFLLTSRTAPDEVVDHVMRCGTNTVQLVDAVNPATYPALRRAAPHIRIVQVIHVQSPDSLEEARIAAEHADMLLLDSGRPSAAIKELGGTGRVHDWAISRRIVETVDRPVFLAGGLSPANAAEALRRVAPYGLDICSGVRTAGRLDPAKLAALRAAIG